MPKPKSATRSRPADVQPANANEVAPEAANAVARPVESSAELVAYWLLKDIAYAEGRDFRDVAAADRPVHRRWILNTYRECLRAVRDTGGEVE